MKIIAKSVLFFFSFLSKGEKMSVLSDSNRSRLGGFQSQGSPPNSEITPARCTPA